MTAAFLIPTEPVVIAQATRTGRVWPLLTAENGEHGCAFFTTAGKAKAFAKAMGLGPEWHVSRTQLADLLSTLRYNLTHGIPWLVIDPEGLTAPAVRTLEFLIEVESQGE
jgi:hypothetical protein